MEAFQFDFIFCGSLSIVPCVVHFIFLPAGKGRFATRHFTTTLLRTND